MDSTLVSDWSLPILPSSESLNIAALAGLFRHTTNSYKFVFFLGLLELLQRHCFDAERPYTYAEITVEMLATAWFAHSFSKLSFGTQDTIAKKLDDLTLGIGDKPVILAGDRAKLRAALVVSDLRRAGRLMDFVPYRLLIPFLEPHLRQVDKGAWMVFEHAMPAITNDYFETIRPLYRFDSDDYSKCSAIQWHPDWVQYFKAHHAIIHGWAAWHWLQYMQRRNPATPALANKLFPPVKRDPLTRQTHYWREILRRAPVGVLRCVYSGASLAANDFALDHYLPWSFVAHDQLWNLVPVPPAVNSAKSNKLPSTEYLDGFVGLQHAGLLIAARAFGARQFANLTEPYLADLHLPTADALLDRDRLRGAYAQSVEPLLRLAENQGFAAGWRYGG